MENRIRLREAVLQAQLQGQVIVKGQLANKLFPSDNPKSSSVTFYKYMTGKSFKIDRETIARICDELDCDANFLFGTEPKLNNGNNGTETEAEPSGNSGSL